MLLSHATTKAGRTQRALLDLLREHEQADALPTSPRFLFYELEQRGLAVKPDPDDPRPNKRRSHGWPPGSQDVGDALDHLREEGIIPWSWITDETRRVSVFMHAPTVAAYLRDRLEEATLNPWGTSAPPLILCESRATAGVLDRTAGDYVCPIAGTAGQCGGFLRTEIAPLLLSESSKPRQVLYLGDLDRSGADIEANTRSVLEREVDARLEWRRLGMTAEQVAEHGIKPIWKVDGRDRKGHWAVEVESLGQAGVVALVRRTLDELLPEPLEDVLAREAEEKHAEAGRLAELGDEAT